MNGKHATVPVFVPHLACPNDCVFCNQRRIAGTTEAVKDVYGYLKDAMSKMYRDFSQVDIAFFGGSFTGIGEAEMRRYLSAAAQIRREDRRITGIRLSTRPDYINSGVLDILREYGVTAVELGAQSMDDEVLAASNRGHTAAATVAAARIIREYGFELVLQLMLGLPGDTPQKDLETAEKAFALCPDGIRIYPCVVIRQTRLQELYEQGCYVPYTVDEAAHISAKIVMQAVRKNIKILRIGLHSSDIVRDDSVVAGPFHPAFGEMVMQRIYLERARKLLGEIFSRSSPGRIIIRVAPGHTSKMTGQKRCNIIALCSEYKTKIKIIEDPRLSDDEIIAEGE